MKFHAPLLKCGTLKCQTQISKKKNWKGQKEGNEKTNCFYYVGEANFKSKLIVNH